MKSDADNYKKFIGPAETYDISGATQFNLLTLLGLRQYHKLLDIGCGSLRAGKLFIPYLLKNCYFGIEPEPWLIDEAIKNEIGKDIILIKEPKFANNHDFSAISFAEKFDFLLAHSIFSHASQAQITQCLQQSIKVMKKTSFFIATYAIGITDYNRDKWLYPEVARYTEDRIKELIENQGLIAKKLDWFHPYRQKWIIITFPENEKNIPELNEHLVYYYKEKLDYYINQLDKLENHPYVKFGMRVSRFIKKK